MLTFKLARVGKKNQPSFRLVLVEKAKDPWGKVVEVVGHINPLTEPATITLQTDRVKHWLSKGAQATDTVWNLFVDQKLVEGEKKKTIYLSKSRKEKMVKKAA